MPYASSIQVINDANGTAYAFLEIDGLLWQCQWNPEAQRWDKGQVVPGAYGGEKLQALLVDNLWPTGGTGNTSGNTPGIVLAYRVGEGDNATVQATLGSWGSDGQLTWSEPLQLVGSGSAIEEIHLAQTQIGGFQLVYQGRDPLGAGSASALKAEGSGSTPQNDSDLLSCKFELTANGASTETSYNLVNIQTPGTPSPINFFESSSLATPQVQFSGGGSSFSRSELQFLQAPAAANNQQLTSNSYLASIQASAIPPAASQSTGSNGFTKDNTDLTYQKKNINGNGTLTAGFNWSSQQVRWQWQPIDTESEFNNEAYFPVSDKGGNLTLSTNFLDFWGTANKLSIKGSFGAATFGQQSATSSGAIVWEPFSKDRKTVLRNSLDNKAIKGEWRNSLKASFSGSASTTYSFQSLLPWSGNNYLKKIIQKSNFSVGLNDELKKVFLATDFPILLRSTASIDVGFAFVNTISPSPKATSAAFAFPNWIRDVGDAYAYGGSAMGWLEAPIGEISRRNLNQSFEDYKQLERQNYRKWPVDTALSFAGAAGIIFPEFLYISKSGNHNSQLQSTQKYGYSLASSVSGTLLFGGLSGPNIILSDLFQHFPKREPYITNSLTVAVNWILPLGPKINIFSDTFNWQKPSLKTTKSSLNSPSPELAEPQNGLLGDTSSLSTSAVSNSKYPFYYEPSQGSILLAGSDLNSVQPLAGGSPQLKLLTLSGYSAGVVTVATKTTPVVLQNAGSGLNDGVYSNVAVMGISLPGSAPATLDFTVANGAIVANTIVINSPGTGAGLYLQLPETSLGNGIYVLIPNVFSTGNNSVPILPNPAPGSSVALLDLLQQLPVITVDTSRTGSPLPKNPPSILAIQPKIPLATPITSATYPNQTPSDNSLISYSNVAIQINNNSVTLLNQATATVSLSNGTIVRVVLDQPLYLQSSAATTPTKVDLTLDMQAALDSTVTNPTYSVTLQAVGLNNVVEDNSFSANSSNTGSTLLATPAQAVWLANGINDQFQATPSQAAWPVFNRVVVQAFDGSLTYLNSSTTSSNESVVQTTTVPDEVQLNNLYPKIENSPGEVPSFSSASTPTAITISGPLGATLTGDSAVFWVEASQPVIPQTTIDGSQNYQAFMNALYGNQRINYRIFTQKTEGWSVPNTFDLYSPTNAVIRNLKAFQVDMGDSPQTMLVWDETSIDTIKGNEPKAISINGWIDDKQLSLNGLTTGLRIGDLITGDGVEKGTLITGIVTAFDAVSRTAVYNINLSQDVGSSSQPVALNAYPLLPPTVLKAGFINPAANNYQWQTLFSDSNGDSTITTIPWDQANDIGLGIESLSVASQQTVDASGNFQDSALLTWSQDVRTPYGQAVLNDEPLIYLQFGDLQPGFNSINLGSTGTSNTGTVASSTGLDFTVSSALPKSSASAVQNIDGTGVLSTGTGSQNALYESVINNTPVDQLPSSPFAQLTASITGTTLTVTALNGNLDQGDLLTGPGLQPDTQIIGVLSAFDRTTGTGTYSINQSQNLSSASFEALPNQAPLSNKELGLPYSSFIGSINGATLSVSQLSGSLAVRDRIYGEGVSEGTTITEVISFDSTTGTGSYTLSQSQQQLSAYALIATPPISSAPYTIEFWTQLPADSNGDQGAGLVAFGQPSPQAVGGYEAPSGWLLSASFSVAQITYQLAAAQGSQDAYDQLNANTAQPSDLFAWGWSLDATGANTTALGGNGGSNLYSNSLIINNLANGQTIAGVNAFLANYGLTAADLVGGDGLYANSIDLVPGISLDFNNSLNPNTGLPVSNLNAVNIDTTSAPLNSGLVAINANGDLNTDPATNQNLQNMFQTLWNYQVQYGEAKVGFTLNPEAAPQPGYGFEQYGGYTLDFTVAPGPAISVNKQGQLVFDVADGVSITSAATNPSDNRQSPLPSDLRDGEWHYVVATYLPDFLPYTINGVATQVPVDRGTASLYVNNQLVASASGVTNPYVASNINDTALLLANNAGGAIDQFAVYNEALLPASPLPSGGFWPEVSQQNVLGILKELGYPATEQTPNPGAIESAISSHWRSRNVNPNDALLGTYSSSFTPSSPGSLLGSWSEAAPLNPITQPQATTPSATASSLQQDLVISIASSDWGKNNWFVGSIPQADPFNPANQELKTVTLVLTSTSDGTETTITRTLSPEQVLMGSNTIESLQATASISDFNYTLLSATPALNLVVSRKPNPKQSGDEGEIKSKDIYSAKVTLNFAGGTSVSNTSGSQTGLNLSLNSAGAGLIQSIGSATTNTNLTKRTTALATAEVIEAAPLQLKYIDSGVVLHSASSQAAANSPSISSPAQTFGQSQAFGWFETSTDNYSSWLAIAQPTSANASSNPAGRVWIQYTGDFTSSNAATSTHTAVTDANKAPITWLNALANSNFTPENPNLPLINSATYKASYGGLLIQADPTAGWGQNFGQTMLVANIVGNNSNDLVISAPNANGGGKVIIIDGTWIASNLTNTSGSSILNLSNPEELGPYVKVLSPPVPSGTAYKNDDASQAAFGWALAVDESTSTLWIGAPNYSRTVGPESESVPIGAVYTYQKGNLSSNYAVGMAGSTSTNDLSGPLTTYWGSQLGASLAFSAEAGLAVGAPGVQASMLYSGTEAAEQAAALNKVSSTAYGQGALVKIMLPTPLSSPSSGIDVSVSSSDGTSNAALVDVITNNPTHKTSALAQEESTYMQALKNVQTKSIAKANTINNPAIQTAAVGSVYLFNPGANLPTGTLAPASASKTFYGPNPWNTIGGSDFGASLSFADIKNTNQQDILAVGAPQAGGSGAVYLLNTSQAFSNDTNLGSKSLGENQYLAYLTSALTLYGAEEFDAFGNGTLNLGDTNNDGYDDLLIQAFNAASGAGNGYVIFGGDNLIAHAKDNTSLTRSLSKFNPAVGSVRAGNIGQLSFADGSSYTTPILAELGYGISAATGQGSYGAGDFNSDGLNDIPLGSGPNGSSYLTWGHPYLEAITNLQLDKLASNTGYLLDGLATSTQGSLRSIGDFNGDGYGDFISINPGNALTTVRIELGANTQEILADYAYEYYSFTVTNGTEVLPGGDINGDGMDDIVLFLDQNLSSSADGNQGAGSSTGILYGRSSNDLPLGSGFGFLAPVGSDGQPAMALPGGDISGGLTGNAPAVINVGNTIYSVVTGINATSLWFSQSIDGGSTWSGWSNITNTHSDLASGISPSLAFFNNKLYLAYLNTNSTPALCISSWDPASNNPAAWSAPALISDGSSSASSFSSSFSPQLVDRGDALGLIWVDAAGELVSAASTSPISNTTIGALGAPTPWTVIDGGSSPAIPALALDGDTVYMAVQGNGDANIYWTMSTDAGVIWSNWQALPGSMTTASAPSLAVNNGTLYLSYLVVGNNEINITTLTNASTNSWSSPYQIPGQSATYASLISETIGSSTQLAVYYVSNDSSDRILKAYSSSPSSSSSWTTDIQIEYGGGSGVQTASGPLAVTTFNGQSYIAYQGGTTTSPSDLIYLTSSSSAGATNTGSDWSAEGTFNAKVTTGLGLTTSPDGLILSYGNSSQASALQLRELSLNQASGNWSITDSYADTLPSTLSNKVAILSLNTSSALLLAGINSKTNGYSIQTSVRFADSTDSSWSNPIELLERVNTNGTITFQPINASSAPSFTWLGQEGVLAVQQTVNYVEAIQVFTPAANSLSWENVSSFTSGAGDPTITTGPVLTTTDSGLALTYGNSDSSITLQRLNFVSSSGAPLPGVQFNPDGSINTSNADLQWQSTILTESNSGISTALASTPVSVNGNLLLTNVRNTTSQDSQIWINAVPNASDPDSTTWLNSTIQLPDSSSGWSISQQTGTVNNGTLVPHWTGDNGGLSPSAPAFAELNGVLYAAVVGYDTTTDSNDRLLFWNSSTDGGRTWSSWQQVPKYSSNQAPSLAAFNGAIYMGYVGTNAGIFIASLTNPRTNSWTQVEVNNQEGRYIALTSENDELAAYYVGTNNDLYRTATNNPTSGKGWSNSLAIKFSGGNQTASGNLAVTTVPGSGSNSDTTYIAYQGGTPSSPSDTLYLTHSSTQSNGNSSSWSVASISTKPSTANRGGVTLSHNSAGLLLGYPDKLNDELVYVVQQSANSGSTWSSFTTLAAPTGSSLPSSGTNNSFSLLASANSNAVLVGAINNGTGYNNAINTTIVSELPTSTSLSSSQTQSTLSAVGDLNGDGFDDLLVAANNVVVNTFSSPPTLATGLRLISGAATSSQILDNNNSSSSTQNVQLAPWQGLSNSTPVASLSGNGQLTVTSTDSQSGRSQSNSAALPTSTAAFTATAGDTATAQQLFQANAAFTIGKPTAGIPLGDLALISTAGFGDLNGDGYEDYLDPTSATVITGANSQSWTLWSIRAAGDVNGNGVDDVLLSLAPQGPAYVPTSAGSPTALQSVLLDGSLFKIDTGSTTFSLSNLRTPLDPYNRGEIYDVSSTSSSQYVPLLQNWFDPILNFEPGSLKSSSVANSFNPAGAMSYSPPSVAISPQNEIYLLLSGFDNFNSNKNSSGLWMAYQQDGIWSQMEIQKGNNASSYSPSAAFYEGNLYVAYSDVSGNIWVAYSNGNPEEATSWQQYQVKTSTKTNESTTSSPTLIAEQGRLAMYFPSNNGTNSEYVRYLYSNDPDAYGNWGGSYGTTGVYSGSSGQMNFPATKTIPAGPTVTSPIAATTFQGRTVLAFRDYNGSVANGQIILATQDKQSIGSAPSPTAGWKFFNTGISNVNGVGLTTDQSLLYLTASGDYADRTPTSTLWSLSSADSNTWNTPTRTNVGGSPSLVSELTYGVINPFVLNGELLAAWTNSSFDIQVSNLDVSVNVPTQQSLAGYSIDGNIDVNGDGFTDILLSDPSDPAMGVDNQYVLFGGDYLNIASQVGTAGNDTLIGTPLADVIYTLSGADEVISNGGADVIYTGSGDDQISITGNAFFRIDAGSGFDKLLLEGGAGLDYDFSEYFAGTKLRNIELISSVDYGSNTLSFDAAAINAINPDRVLFVTPDASDIIALSSEFQRNRSFDTNYGGVLWNAYAAGEQTSPTSDSPALVYVLNPEGATNANWLSTNVTINTATASSIRLNVVSAAPPGATDSSSESAIPTTSAVYQSVSFGSTLTLTSYRTKHSDGEARFSVSSSDTSKPRALLYAISSANSSAEPGLHYKAIAGVAVLAKGQSSFDITVPINGEAFSQLRKGTLSLRVEEITYSDQLEPIHLLIEPTPAADGGLPPVLSGLSLSLDSSGSTATLEFRADTTNGSADALNLSIARRNSANSVAVSQRRLVSINDFKPVPGDLTPAYNLQNLDHDNSPNQQVQTSLLLNLKPTGNDPLVSHLGPELNWQITVQLLNGNQVRFQQDAPLTSWRADSGAGLVTFGLQSGSNNLNLISNAQGGSAGSLNSNNANGATSWQSTEGKAIGSCSITEGQNLKGSDWTPTASLDGVSLALLNLAVDGNQVTATFSGGVTGVFWQADGNAPSLLPVPVAVEVQRLAGYNNSLGFYSVDSITGMVAGINPGETGYLQAALARSQEEDLLLDARTLPAFGATATFNSLPLDTRERYGVLLLQNGDESKIFSSFAAANEGGATQMVSLSNSSNSRVLGIEDMSVAKGLGDNDFNDIIVKIQGVSLGLF